MVRPVVVNNGGEALICTKLGDYQDLVRDKAFNVVNDILMSEFAQNLILSSEF